MPTESLKDQLLADFERLAPELQLRVREDAHALVGRASEGTPGEALLPFFGVLDDEWADEMEAALRAFRV